MNRLVLIGNGFDLAHGLKTSYKDFIQWYWEKRVAELKTEYIRNKKSDNLCTIKVTDKNTLDLSWQSYLHANRLINVSNDKLYDILKNPEYRTEFSYTSTFFENINHEVETKNWVDIENEYYKLLVRYTKENITESAKRNKIEKLNKDLSLITELLAEYLKTAEEKISKNDRFSKRIFSKIYEEIKPKDIAISAKETYRTFVESKYEQLKMREGKEIDKDSFKHLKESMFKENTYREYREPDSIMLLSFNYTDIVKNYVRDDWGGICNYIHGDLEHEGSIIFGYGDELDENYKKITEENDNQLLKNVKSIRYLESDNYRNVLQFIESAPFQIYIMGHSCGNSDRTLLNTLFEHKNCVSIKPFYYKRKENGIEKDNYLDIAMNISRNFTDQKLLRERVVNKNYCEELNK